MGPRSSFISTMCSMLEEKAPKEAREDYIIQLRELAKEKIGWTGEEFLLLCERDKWRWNHTWNLLTVSRDGEISYMGGAGNIWEAIAIAERRENVEQCIVQ